MREILIYGGGMEGIKRTMKVQEKRFEEEINKIKNRHFDAAFVVLDPRQGEEFYLGFDYFMKNTNTDKVFPMHFWGDSSVIERLKEMKCSEDYRNKIFL